MDKGETKPNMLQASMGLCIFSCRSEKEGEGERVRREGGRRR